MSDELNSIMNLFFDKEFSQMSQQIMDYGEEDFGHDADLLLAEMSEIELCSLLREHLTTRHKVINHEQV